MKNLSKKTCTFQWRTLESSSRGINQTLKIWALKIKNRKAWTVSREAYNLLAEENHTILSAVILGYRVTQSDPWWRCCTVPLPPFCFYKEVLEEGKHYPSCLKLRRIMISFNLPIYYFDLPFYNFNLLI